MTDNLSPRQQKVLDYLFYLDKWNEEDGSLLNWKDFSGEDNNLSPKIVDAILEQAKKSNWQVAGLEVLSINRLKFILNSLVVKDMDAEITERKIKEWLNEMNLDLVSPVAMGNIIEWLWLDKDGG